MPDCGACCAFRKTFKPVKPQNSRQQNYVLKSSKAQYTMFLNVPRRFELFKGKQFCHATE